MDRAAPAPREHRPHSPLNALGAQCLIWTRRAPAVPAPVDAGCDPDDARDASASNGNLPTHLSKLEAAGYVAIEKGYKGKRPRTRAVMTAKGRPHGSPIWAPCRPCSARAQSAFAAQTQKPGGLMGAAGLDVSGLGRLSVDAAGAYIMPPMPPMPPMPLMSGMPPAPSFFGASATLASVVMIRPATDAAFWMA